MDFKSMIVGAIVTILVIYALKVFNRNVKIPAVNEVLDEVLK